MAHKLCIIFILISIVFIDVSYGQRNTSKVIIDNNIKNWVVDRFAGNTKAGPIFYQGAAREIGGLHRPKRVVETPEGVYIASHEDGADNPNLFRVLNGMLRLVMEREGLIEGPMELCQSGYPIWNEFDKTLYLTGPYCIRKVVVAEDGSRRVEIVAGTPNTPGSVDGSARRATLQRPRGWAAAQDGAIYWLEDKALRKFANNTVSTVPLTRPETSDGRLWKLGPGNYLLSAGEDASSLYISNYYDTSHGYSILKVNLKTNEVRSVIGVDRTHPNSGNEMDGPATSSAAFRGGARGIYHPGYDAIFLDGADTKRYRWWRRNNDNWVRTILGSPLPDTVTRPFSIVEANSIGIEGEHFRLGSQRITNYLGVGKNGGVYLGGFTDRSGIWRAYDKTVGSPITVTTFSSKNENAKGSRINAILIGPEGQTLNSPGAIAPSSTGIQAHPRVAYHNGIYLVVWHDLRNGTDFDVLGIRIAGDGTVLDSLPLLIGTGARTQTMPDVAADDRGFMVVWSGFREDDQFPSIFSVRVALDGTVGKPSILADGASPQISWNSHQKKHFVLYVSAHDKYMSPTKNWLIMDANMKVAPSPKYPKHPWIYGVGNGPNHFSACAVPQKDKGWTFITDHQPGNSWNRSIGTQRAINIVPDGTIAADSPTATTKTYIEKYIRPQKPGGGAANWLDYHYDLEHEWPYGGNAATPDGNYCVAVWSRYHVGGMTGISLFDSDLYVSRVDRWKPVEAKPVRVAASSASERDPSLAGNGKGDLVVVYEKLANGTSQIVTRSLNITSQINVGKEEIIIGTKGIRRGSPDIAFGDESAGTYMVVWQEGWHGENEIFPTGDMPPSVEIEKVPIKSSKPQSKPPSPISSELTPPRPLNPEIEPSPVSLPEDTVAIRRTQDKLVQDGGVTPEQISIFLSSNMPDTATASLRYKETADSNWKAGHSLFKIRSGFASGGMRIDDGFAWTILGLTPGTLYDVEVTTHDGSADTVHTAVMATRQLPSLAGRPTKNIPAGSSSAQIQSVFNSAVPGDVIQLDDDTYNVDELKLSRSGTESLPIYIRGQSRKKTILQDKTGTVLQMNACSHIVIENMTLIGSGVDAGVKPSSRGISFWGGYKKSKIKENVTIRNMMIVGVDRGIDVSTEIKQMLVYDNTIIGNNIWDQDFYPYSGSGPPGTGDGTPDIDQNLFWNDDGIRITGQGNAVFNNTISGFGDALSIEKGYKSVGVHFFRNDIRMAGDDGIEGDYGTRNITFYDNRVQNAMTLVSLDPLWGGPFIAARNIGINIGRQTFKLNSKNTGMFFYNNSVVRTQNPQRSSWAWAQPNNGPFHAWGYQNNILIYQGQDQGAGLLAMEPAGQSPIDFTHNSWYPDGRVWWTNSGGSFSNLSSALSSLPPTAPLFSDYTSRHWEDNILHANPFVTNIPLGTTHHKQITKPYIPILVGGSVAKNSGIPINGITDGFSGTAPDRGAIISGIAVPLWGDRSSLQ